MKLRLHGNSLRLRLNQAEVAQFSGEPRDQCHVTFLNIDVTGKIVGEVLRHVGFTDQAA